MPFRPTLRRRCLHDCKLISSLPAVLSSSSPPPSAGALPVARTPAAYNALMSDYSHAGHPGEVLRLFRSLPFPPTAPLYTTLISSLAASGRYLAARAAFARLLVSGVPPTASAYTALLKSHSAASLDSVYLLALSDAFQRLIQGCSPDAATYNCLISMLCDSHRLEEAWGVLDLMLENNIQPTVCSYTAILRGYCKQGRVREAERFFDTVMGTGCLPDVIAYSVLIEGLT